jgi:hypothetical protein
LTSSYTQTHKHRQRTNNITVISPLPASRREEEAAAAPLPDDVIDEVIIKG